VRQGDIVGVRQPILATVVLLMLSLGACGTIPENDPLRPAATASPEAASPMAVDPATPAGGATAMTGTELCEYEPTGDAAKSVRPPSPTGVVTSGAIGYDLEMTEGTVRITLDPVRAPCTVHSFESLADQGFFDATKCHRLVDSGIFLFQCGDPTGTGRGGPGYTFADELDGTESYTKAVIAMANAGANTNGSQFFLVYRDSTALDKTPSYTVFGEVDPSGIGILERMAVEGQDGSNPAGGGRPNNPSEIIKVTKVGG
jgi:peptidyl-prolyl cis-trans isomerase B (cyclophilin B)